MANKMSKEMKNVQKKIDNLVQQKEKKENEIKEIKAEIAKLQAEYKELLRNETVEKLSKAMFSVHDFTSEQAEKLVTMIEKMGSGITDLTESSEKAEKTAEEDTTEEKVDTNINSVGEVK